MPRFNLGKYARPVISVAVLVIIVLVLILGHKPKAAPAGCAPYRADKIVKINGQSIVTEVADSAQAREKGLSGRNCITPNEGMLFIFPKPGRYAIWMKDMKFPIDVLWISRDHKVVGQEVEVKPSTYPDRFINKDKPAQYVLELKAKRSVELKVDLGTPIQF